MVPFLFFKSFLMEVTADQTETNSSILRKHFFFFFFKGHVSGGGVKSFQVCSLKPTESTPTAAAR